jgi:type IV pilus assembly protein PilM
VLAFKSSLRVGLDIGTHAVKLVMAEKGSHGRMKLVKTLSRDIYTGQDKFDPDGAKKTTLVPLLLEMFQEAGIRPKRISHLGTCIGGVNQAAKEIRTMQLSDEDMASSILQEARKHVPLDGSESVVDYQIMGEDPKEADKVRVLVAATTKRMFDAHVDVLREAELKPGIIDLEPLAAANSYMSCNELPDDGTVVFLNIGARRTNLLVLSRKDMFFSRDLPVGGFNFTEDIMKKFGVKFAEAEEIKKTQGITAKDLKTAEASAPGSEFALAEKAPLEKLSEEINRSLRYYVKETGQSFFTRMELVGGMAESPELVAFLTSKFNIEVRAYDPFIQCDGAGDVKHRPQYAAAVGLAQRAQGI